MGSEPTRHPALPPRLSTHGWLADPALRDVFACLASGGFEARAVGGAVRNALMGLPIADIDIATPARPDEVIRLAEAAGLQAIPTGIEHGTVTVVARHKGFEVTTLRRDIETDGRHARVTFSTDWAEDARRRDFTINALYCGADGTVHDPLGGWSDVEARRVRFIGDAKERINEDVLRILRFFRFTAEYVAGNPDAESLAACEALQHGIDQLSGERLRAELLKLVLTPRASGIARIMARSGLLQRVTGNDTDVDAMDRLVQLEDALGRPPSAILRLAALASRSTAAARSVADRLRLSNSESAVLVRAADRDAGSHVTASEHDARLAIYRLGRDTFENDVLLSWAYCGDSLDDEAWRARYGLGERFPRPVLPVRGSDILALGIPPGPEVGRILRAFEDWWIDSGFPTDPALTASTLDRLNAAASRDASRDC